MKRKNNKNSNFVTDSGISETDCKVIRFLFIKRGLGMDEIEVHFKHKYNNHQIRTALREILLGYGNWVEIFRWELYWDESERN